MRHAIQAKTVYSQTSDIRGILVDNNIAEHSDVAGASPVGAFST